MNQAIGLANRGKGNHGHASKAPTHQIFTKMRRIYIAKKLWTGFSTIYQTRAFSSTSLKHLTTNIQQERVVKAGRHPFLLRIISIHPGRTTLTSLYKVRSVNIGFLGRVYMIDRYIGDGILFVEEGVDNARTCR